MEILLGEKLSLREAFLAEGFLAESLHRREDPVSIMRRPLVAGEGWFAIAHFLEFIA